MGYIIFEEILKLLMEYYLKKIVMGYAHDPSGKNGLILPFLLLSLTQMID